MGKIRFNRIKTPIFKNSLIFIGWTIKQHIDRVICIETLRKIPDGTWYILPTVQYAPNPSPDPEFKRYPNHTLHFRWLRWEFMISNTSTYWQDPDKEDECYFDEHEYLDEEQYHQHPESGSTDIITWQDYEQL